MPNSSQRSLSYVENPEKTLEYLRQVEELAEEILRDRQEIVALDKRRNKNREAIRALRNTKENRKAWISVGNLLVKMPTAKADTLLNSDQTLVDVEVNKLRSNLKLKVNKLRDMEYKSPVPGLMLQPLSHSEISSIKAALGVQV